MKILFTEAREQDQNDLSRLFPNLEVATQADPLSIETISDAAKTAELLSVFVDSRVTKEVLDQMPNLKFIATRSTGYDHLDFNECQRRGIVVSTVPVYGENTVAEHAFALILALSRKIFQSYERTERMDFNREGLQGFDLLGKTLGVVGTGHIGQHSIRIGAAFGMKVIAFDAFPNQELAAKEGFEYVPTLDDLLSRSHVITLHVPYLPSTHHMINVDNVKKIKPGAILVNTARGALVDTQALLWALEEKILSGAGLDVLEGEEDLYEDITLLSKGFPKDHDIATLLRNHILIARRDVILTPHNAFNSMEAVQRIFDTTVENIKGFVEGQPVNVAKAK